VASLEEKDVRALRGDGGGVEDVRGGPGSRRGSGDRSGAEARTACQSRNGADARMKGDTWVVHDVISLRSAGI
jgi:hypothetical protein